MTRPTLLFLSHVLPHPPDSGVTVRTHNILRILGEAYDISAVCFYRRRARADMHSLEHSVRALAGIARVQAFPIPQEHSRRRLLWDHLRSVITGRAYTRYVYDAAEYRNAVAGLLAKDRFALIHVDSLDLCAYLPLLPLNRVVCVHHNVESRLLDRRAEAESSPWRRAYIRLQAKLTRREERRWCERVALNVAVSDADAQELLRIAPRARLAVVPNGVDVREFEPTAASGSTVAFLGGTEWMPNRDALEYFAHEILPRIRSAGLDPRIRWIGRASAEERAHFLAEHGIELTGYVPDIRPHVRDAGCMVVPLRVGGGTRLKITTAWALGKAVVTTSVGCEGLAVRDGQNAIIRDDPGQFAGAVVALLRNERLRAAIGAAGRRTAEDVYNWRVIGADMLSEYARARRAAGESREQAQPPL